MRTTATRTDAGRASPRFWDETTETMAREELREHQLERLRRQVARCYEHSILFRRKFEEAGAEPGDIRHLDDFARLPLLTKEELREDQTEHPPFGTCAVAEPGAWREVHPSTGTTGTPVNTIWSERDVETITDVTARTLWQFGVRPGDVVQNAFSYGLWVAGLSVHYAAQEFGCLVVPIGTQVATQTQIDYLRRVGPTVLIATPSYALYIAEELRRLGIHPEELALRRGGFGGEAGVENEATRAKIEESLSIDAFDYYGLAEIGPTFASECEAKNGLHFAEDHVFVECLDPETRKPVSEGGVGVLVFTHLTREATPLLRYWSNDYARVSSEPCRCGRTHIRTPGGILGRHDDLLVFKGAKFYPSQVERVVRSLPELGDEFRIEVLRDEAGVRVEACTVVVERIDTPDDVSLQERLRAALKAELGVTPVVRLEPFGTLERTTFKALRIVEL